MKHHWLEGLVLQVLNRLFGYQNFVRKTQNEWPNFVGHLFTNLFPLSAKTSYPSSWGIDVRIRTLWFWTQLICDKAGNKKLFLSQQISETIRVSYIQIDIGTDEFRDENQPFLRRLHLRQCQWRYSMVFPVFVATMALLNNGSTDGYKCIRIYKFSALMKLRISNDPPMKTNT